MENVTESKKGNNHSNTLSIIAISLSIVSILFSSFTLVKTGNVHKRGFDRPFAMQNEIGDSYARNNQEFSERPFNDNFRFNKPGSNSQRPDMGNGMRKSRRDNNAPNFDDGGNQNQPSNNGPKTAPEVSP